MNLTGVLLLNFGGPDTMEAVEPFVSNILGGKKVPPMVLEKIKERYKLIGGSSPLVRITEAQAIKLEEELNKTGEKFKVYIGMLHWHPFIYETLEKMAQDGVKKIVVLSLAPFYSRVSTGAYKKAIEEALDKYHFNFELLYVNPWHTEPLYIEAMEERIKEDLEKFRDKEEVQIIFSAHSLPVQHILDGDAYQEQFQEAVQEVVEKLGKVEWYLAYQSKGGGQGEWLGPEVEKVMDNLVLKDKKDVLLVPMGFVSDHVETLYDIDISMKNYAGTLGINFHRCTALNDTPKFIKALANITQKLLNCDNLM